MMKNIKRVVVISTAAMLALSSIAIADTSNNRATNQTNERPSVERPQILPQNQQNTNIREQLSIEQQYLTKMAEVRDMVAKIRNNDKKSEYIQNVQAVYDTRDSFESKIKRLNQVEREVRAILSSEQQPQREQIEPKQPNVAEERDVHRLYLAEMQKLRQMITSIGDPQIKTRLLREAQAIHNTRDSFENKITRIAELEELIYDLYSQEGENAVAFKQKFERAQALTNQLGREGALELRQQLAERQQLLQAQERLEQAEKQALRARAVQERLFIKGKTLKYDVPPVIREGRTLVPVRAITEGLGAEVQWDQELKKITITKDGKEIILFLDSAEVIVNGEAYQLEVPAQLTNNRTLVPLRFVSEILGESVDYEDQTGDIDIGLGDLDALDLLDEDEEETELDKLLEELEEELKEELEE
ncbi:stalk domain-containing protein [Desulfuribacillus alkaliarsenatis]|uniref:Copper amine oxidase-like N-terminal domain-containing protein n=1 Tax=Desulfuribacillus alkaliarsenatis TaxID=766136 RepID=A0A1E5G3E2_9FIRM|nr:stalk domain-containing protein [Desulfuribacillus alkaliarsenatis]OEF97490.1 hypothetical protein BHF68_04600 [Desulfuribacillus alkaliarsenatis]